MKSEQFKHSIYPFVNNCEFSFLHINVCSLSKNQDILNLYLYRLDYPIKVIGITETWLSMDNATLYNVANFNHIYRCRKDQMGGGVSIFVNPELRYLVRKDLEAHFVRSAVRSLGHYYFFNFYQ